VKSLSDAVLELIGACPSGSGFRLKTDVAVADAGKEDDGGLLYDW
jgi:hypothetical protein